MSIIVNLLLSSIWLISHKVLQNLMMQDHALLSWTKHHILFAEGTWWDREAPENSRNSLHEGGLERSQRFCRQWAHQNTHKVSGQNIWVQTPSECCNKVLWEPQTGVDRKRFFCLVTRVYVSQSTIWYCQHYHDLKAYGVQFVQATLNHVVTHTHCFQ